MVGTSNKSVPVTWPLSHGSLGASWISFSSGLGPSKQSKSPKPEVVYYPIFSWGIWESKYNTYIHIYIYLYIISMCNNNASIGLSIQSFLRIPMRKNITLASVPRSKKNWAQVETSSQVNICYIVLHCSKSCFKYKKNVKENNTCGTGVALK
jgi:hypothetical protein